MNHSLRDPLNVGNWTKVPDFNHSPNKHIRLKRFDHFKRRMARLLAKSIQHEVRR